MYDLSKFEKAIGDLGLSLTEKQYKQYVTYYEMLVEKNKVMNLTGITDFDEVILKHFIDSLSIVNITDMNKVTSVIDVGTGAGFPGLPLKIAFPHLEMVLLDSLKKRLNFLDEVICALDIDNIKTVHGRSEDAAHDIKLRGNFDLCVSRAVANMSVLTEYCIPFIKIGGTFTAYKAGSSEDEIEQSKKAVDILGGKITNIKKFNLPESDIERVLVEVKKIKDTPKKYPRKAGLPLKEPIK